MIPFGTTEHLLLRPFRESDLPAHRALGNDLRVAQGLRSSDAVPLPPLSWADFRPLLEKTFLALVLEVKREYLYLRGDDPLEVEDESESESEEQRRERRKFVGVVSLDLGEEKHRDVSLGIGLAFAWWGKGLGTEVMRWLLGHTFNVLSMHRMSLNVFGDNERAIELYKYLGFVEEGRVREGLLRESGWVDLVHMGMLDREWHARKAALAEEDELLSSFDHVVVACVSALL